MASPSQLLGLSKNWKWQGPTAEGGKIIERKQPALQTYSDSNIRVSGDRVLFTAKCGGYTTSGSAYPRSELREMRNNGKDLAGWSNRSGTHIMTLDQAFLHLPSKKPHVVAGQIHGGDDDVTVCRLEGKKLWVTRGDDTNFHLLDSNYALGTRFTITFDARPGGIDITYNGGGVDVTVPGNYSGCYFKAGCYTQSNPSKGDSPSDYGQVAIWNLTMGPAPAPPPRPAAPKPPVDDDNPCGG